MLTAALPTFNRFAGRLGWRKTYNELSERSWTLAPSCVRHEPPCLYDPADLARVVGYVPYSSPELERERMEGGRLEHGACRAHLLRDVALMNGHLFRPGMTFMLSDGPVPWAASEPEEERESAVLASTHFGFRYFGHWVGDDLPMRMVARDVGEPVTWKQPLTEHQVGYGSRLGLEVEALGPVRFRELIVVDDRGQNMDKRRRWQEMRARLHGWRRPEAHAGVMLVRGLTGERRQLLNEEAVADALVARGFRIARPGQQTTAELIEACAGARVVVSVEGSQNAHGLLNMADGGTMIALQPPNRFGNVYKDRCDCLGLRYGFAVGHAAEGGGFTIDIDALQRLLDRAATLAH
ncbi:MAG TPA: glycosyltransferase family 61 protein [Methylibium sp.]|uniref:glycosyltransferase family 61 protein n=1 Tax=Methylibium sp. TaxID=2067992 RepID=UPI002DB772A2|nr:glycosyltransferase family 61 protein [Methylibium sp.]HEU4459238.1 glycosyltransferase family 61 protein [Methylibium sp.]